MEIIREKVVAWLQISSSIESRFHLILFLLAALLIVSPAQSRESDATQPINVRADRSEFDEKAGLQTLTGNVEISQGTMKINADSVAISLKDNALSKIVGKGSPIRFQQENEAGELMQGEARQIVYDALNGTLLLEGSASLKQPRQNLVSERITFDSRTQKVSAEGGGSTGRVNIQIQPPTTSK
ncbi:MAG: lipopolysaccharide transport periplasmic protein LptA [Granulosicoccus sp.]|nr:lipopolysaccharide transport periplasmic protein LptA [Granulosicoccus sp.]